MLGGKQYNFENYGFVRNRRPMALVFWWWEKEWQCIVSAQGITRATRTQVVVLTNQVLSGSKPGEEGLRQVPWSLQSHGLFWWWKLTWDSIFFLLPSALAHHKKETTSEIFYKLESRRKKIWPCPAGGQILQTEKSQVNSGCSFHHSLMTLSHLGLFKVITPALPILSHFPLRVALCFLSINQSIKKSSTFATWKGKPFLLQDEKAVLKFWKKILSFLF